MVNYFKRKVKRLTFWDIAFLILYGAIPALFIGAYFPSSLKIFGAPLVAIFVILFLRYSYIIFYEGQNLGLWSRLIDQIYQKKM